MKKYYYINLLSWRCNTIKETMLCEYLAGYEYTLVEFGDDYTPDVFLSDLQKRVNGINASSKRSGDIFIRMREGKYDGELIFSFYRMNHSGESSAIMRLNPVKRWLAGSSSVSKSDAE